MPVAIVNLIIAYGYWAIFCLVLLQEMGVPGLPNELVLLYFGYLAYTTAISLTGILVAAISADIVGTSCLYTIFYFFGKQITRWQPNRLPKLRRKLGTIKAKTTASHSSFLIIRLTPFIRGYTSVVAGLLRVNTKKYAQSIVASAIIWNSFFIVTGYFLSIYLGNFIATLPKMPLKISISLSLFVLFCIIAYKNIVKYSDSKSSTKTCTV